MKRMLSITALAALALAGCKESHLGHFGAGGFYHVRDHYRVRYVEGGEAGRTLLPQPWRLTNFQRSADGSPGAPLMDAEHWETLETGMVGRRRTRARAPIHDLRFEHEDGSILFVRSVPIAPGLDQAPPAVLLQDYVQRAVYGYQRISAVLGAERTLIQRAWRTVREGPARVDGAPAYFATLEVGVSNTGTPPVAQVTLVAFRPGTHRWALRRGGGWPMMVVVGLSSSVEHHDAHAADLQSLASRLDINPNSAR